MKSERLNIVQCTIDILEAAIQSNEALAKKLGVNVLDQWSEFGPGPFSWVLEKLKDDPESLGWWTYFPIHIDDNTLIGSGGFKGPADENGYVEIGYEIAPKYRKNGYATEMAQAFIQFAESHQHINGVIAHTLAIENESTSILKKCGFIKTNEIQDLEDGLIWRWEKQKANPSTNI